MVEEMKFAGLINQPGSFRYRCASYRRTQMRGEQREKSGLQHQYP